MVILGIDPGTRRMGYGAIRIDGRRVELLGAGILNVRAKDDLGALSEARKELRKIIRRFRPETLAVEKLFFSKNQKTGMQVAQARGVILSCGLEAGLQIVELSPNQIKLSVAGYGHADKRGVLKMVKLILGRPDLKVIDDASDALAAAICAGQNSGLDRATS